MRDIINNAILRDWVLFLLSDETIKKYDDFSSFIVGFESRYSSKSIKKMNRYWIGRKLHMNLPHNYLIEFVQIDSRTETRRFSSKAEVDAFLSKMNHLIYWKCVYELNIKSSGKKIIIGNDLFNEILKANYGQYEIFEGILDYHWEQGYEGQRLVHVYTGDDLENRDYDHLIVIPRKEVCLLEIDGNIHVAFNDLKAASRDSFRISYYLFGYDVDDWKKIVGQNKSVKMYLFKNEKCLMDLSTEKWP